jgi:hypothetical protein
MVTSVNHYSEPPYLASKHDLMHIQLALYEVWGGK